MVQVREGGQNAPETLQNKQIQIVARGTWEEGVWAGESNIGGRVVMPTLSPSHYEHTMTLMQWFVCALPDVYYYIALHCKNLLHENLKYKALHYYSIFLSSLEYVEKMSGDSVQK